MKDNKERKKVLAAVKEDPYSLMNADDSFKKDKEIVLTAVRRYGPILKFADESLKKDKEIVMEAIKVDSLALEFADESLKKDREIILSAVMINTDALEYADESLKKDKEIFMLAVKQDGWALQYADETIKKDREIVMLAVRQQGGALVLADESFKKDKEVVLTAVRQYGPALNSVDESFKKDREIVLAAVNNNGMAIQFADESFKKDREIVKAAVKNDSRALKFASNSVRKELDDKNYGKRRFRIDAGNYGGELVVGTVDEAFIEHFANNKKDPELIDNWYEEDDIVHLNCCYSDSGFSWCEVEVDGSDDYDDSDVKEFEAHHLYVRENPIELSKPNEDDIKEGDEWIPVLAYCSSSKGNHGCWFVETNDENFDPKKVAFSSVDTYVASIVEDVWYDKKKLDHDSTWMDSTHKGNDAEVGWMNSRLHDTLESIQVNIKAYWEDYEYTLEE